MKFNIFYKRYGGSERVYRLEFVSNQDFTDTEFFKWKETMMTQGYTLPGSAELQRKLKELQEAHQYKFKDDDVDNVRLKQACLYENGTSCILDSLFYRFHL